MTTLAEHQTHLFESFAAAWGALTPVAYDNVTFYPSNSPNGWASVHFEQGQGADDTIAAPVIRYNGRILIDTMVPENVGITEAYILADVALNFLELYRPLPGARIPRNPGLQEIGAEQGWYRIQVFADFQYDTA